MTSETERRSGGDILRIFLSGRMLAALLMGFSSGLPLLLATGSVLQAWLKEAGVDLGTVSYTHLDVYKRQARGRARVARRWSS